MLPLQIVRDPEKIKPPDGANHEFPRRERPGLLVWQKLRPFDIPGRRFRIALDIFTLAVGAVRMLLRCPVEQQPQNKPCKPETPPQPASPPPSQVLADPHTDNPVNAL